MFMSVVFVKCRVICESWNLLERLQDRFQMIEAGAADKCVEVFCWLTLAFINLQQRLGNFHAVLSGKLAQQRTELRLVQSCLPPDGHKVCRHTVLFMRKGRCRESDVRG